MSLPLYLPLPRSVLLLYYLYLLSTGDSLTLADVGRRRFVARDSALWQEIETAFLAGNEDSLDTAVRTGTQGRFKERRKFPRMWSKEQFLLAGDERSPFELEILSIENVRDEVRAEAYGKVKQRMQREGRAENDDDEMMSSPSPLDVVLEPAPAYTANVAEALPNLVQGFEPLDASVGEMFAFHGAADWVLRQVATNGYDLGRYY